MADQQLDPRNQDIQALRDKATNDSGSVVDPDTQRALDMYRRYQVQPHTQVSVPPVQPKFQRGSAAKDIGIAALNMFVPFLGGAVQKSVKAQRDQQINDVVVRLGTIQDRIEMAEYLSGGDEQKKKEILDQDPQLRAIFSGKESQKFVKGMQKVFGTSLLDSEKQNTVFHEGIKKHIQLQKAESQVKQAHQAQQQWQQSASNPTTGAQVKGPSVDGMQPSEAINRIPQKPQFTDPSKLASLENAMRRDSTSEQAMAIRALTAALTAEHQKQTEKQGDERIAQGDKKIEQGNKRLELQGKTLDERKREFGETMEFKKWKENRDIDTKVRVAMMSQSKPSSTLQPVAIFSRTGLHQLDDAEAALKDLEARGVLGNVLGNKVEDYVFGKGLVDPRLDPEIRKDIGKIRAAMAYTSSAAMRAHTGRTSREIYDDFKNTLRIGQDTDALMGAIEQTRSMMTEYANVITPEAFEALKHPVGGGAKPAASKPATANKPKVYGKNEIPD